MCYKYCCLWLHIQVASELPGPFMMACTLAQSGLRRQLNTLCWHIGLQKTVKFWYSIEIFISMPFHIALIKARKLSNLIYSCPETEDLCSNFKKLKILSKNCHGYHPWSKFSLTEEAPAWTESHHHFHGRKSQRCLGNECMQQKYSHTFMDMKDEKHLDTVGDWKSF